MTWIKSEIGLAHHPKIKKLARLLNIPIPQAIGHVHLLWWFATEYAREGNLADFDESDLAEAMYWEKEPSILLNALRKTHLLDGNKIHDWYEYAGALIEKRDADAKRMREYRAKQKQAKIGSPSISDEKQLRRVDREDDYL